MKLLKFYSLGISPCHLFQSGSQTKSHRAVGEPFAITWVMFNTPLFSFLLSNGALAFTLSGGPPNYTSGCYLLYQKQLKFIPPTPKAGNHMLVLQTSKVTEAAILCTFPKEARIYLWEATHISFRLPREENKGPRCQSVHLNSAGIPSSDYTSLRAPLPAILKRVESRQ